MNNKKYTEDEIETIRQNLKSALGVENIVIDVYIGKLISETKLPKFKFIKGEQFMFFNANVDLERGLDVGWHLIEITYQRLDLVFFKYPTSTKPKKEHYATKYSIFVSRLIPVNLDVKRFGINEMNLPLIVFDKHKAPFTLFVYNKGQLLQTI